MASPRAHRKFGLFFFVVSANRGCDLALWCRGALSAVSERDKALSSPALYQDLLRSGDRRASAAAQGGDRLLPTPSCHGGRWVGCGEQEAAAAQVSPACVCRLLPCPTPLF